MVKNIQTAGYNGARTVCISHTLKIHRVTKKSNSVHLRLTFHFQEITKRYKKMEPIKAIDNSVEEELTASQGNYYRVSSSVWLQQI